MLNIIVIYGGSSCERDISVITGVQCLKNIPKDKYNVIPVLYRDDQFYIPEYPLCLKGYIQEDSKKFKKVFFTNKALYKEVGRKKIKHVVDIDCVLLCTHGGKGEDGCIQGFFETLDIPYTSSNVAASYKGMDKSDFKVYAKDLGIEVLPYIVVNKENGIIESSNNIRKSINFPIMVKPCAQGSSIGISLAKNKEELEEALSIAFNFDTKAICERGLDNFKELNCAVVKADDAYIVSDIEEPLVWNDYLTYEDKYFNTREVKFPADISNELENEVKSIALKLYKELGCFGVVRFDFLLDKNLNTIFVNEINTIPGSMANYLFRNKGISYESLICILINQAIKRNKTILKPQFESEVLVKYNCENKCKFLVK